MGFKFRCSHCGRTHDTRSDSALIHPGGTILGVPWYFDDRGTMHLAMVCLRCGTVHDAYGSPAKALLSFGGRALQVERVFPIERLTYPAGLTTADPPWQVLWALVDRGFLRQEMIEARGVSGGLFFLPTDEEEVGKEIAVHAAIVMLATYTSLIGAERVDNSVLESFVDKADVYAAATEKTPFMDEHLSATKLLLYMLEQGLPRQEIFRRAQQILNEAGESAD